MVMAKSCLYQTQRSGLTITANGHICHGTKMCALSVCAVCVFCVHLYFLLIYLFLLLHLHGMRFLEDKVTQQSKMPTGWLRIVLTDREDYTAH